MATVLHDGKEIEYTLRKSKRKTIALTISTHGEIILRCPNKVSESRAIEFLLSKMKWVLKHISIIQNRGLSQTFIREYKNGEEYYLFGFKYTFEIIIGDVDSVLIVENRIVITQKNEGNQNTKKVFMKWLDGEVERIFAERYVSIFQKFNYEFAPRVQIKNMKRRWGSFRTTGFISLNKQLLHTPIECLDYVIYHELCHYKHMNHGKRFYNLLEQKLPNYKEIEKRLRHYGKLIGM